MSYIKCLTLNYSPDLDIAWTVGVRGIRKIPHKTLLEIDVPKLCNNIIQAITQSHTLKKNLRISGTLVNGTVKIYSVQVNNVYRMVLDLYDRIKVQPIDFRERILSQELLKRIKTQKKRAIEFGIPSIEELDEMLSQPSYNVADISQITLREEPDELNHFQADFGPIVSERGGILLEPQLDLDEDRRRSTLKQPPRKLLKKTGDKEAVTLVKSPTSTTRRLSLEKVQTPPVQSVRVTPPMPETELPAPTIQPTSSSSSTKEEEELPKRERSRIVKQKDFNVIVISRDKNLYINLNQTQMKEERFKIKTTFKISESVKDELDINSKEIFGTIELQIPSPVPVQRRTQQILSPPLEAEKMAALETVRQRPPKPLSPLIIVREAPVETLEISLGETPVTERETANGISRMPSMEVSPASPRITPTTVAVRETPIIESRQLTSFEIFNRRQSLLEKINNWNFNERNLLIEDLCTRLHRRNVAATFNDLLHLQKENLIRLVTKPNSTELDHIVRV